MIEMAPAIQNPGDTLGLLLVVAYIKAAQLPTKVIAQVFPGRGIASFWTSFPIGTDAM